MINKDYSHLLCRPERTFDESAIDKELSGKRILITGAGGSIGSALSQRILAANPAKVYLLGHGEDSIFQLVRWLRNGFNESLPIHEMICDVYSTEVDALLRTGLHKIDYVFHTAAHKHVGLMETNPRAAIMNNTQATIWLGRKCKEVGTRLVNVSTDKAVKPTTVMGASKKLAEAWLDANCQDHRVTIRLGNVLGSAGSLVEIVEKLNQTGGKFLLNHRDMARYFITAKEAAGLILAGGTNFPGKYTLDMGKPLLISALVKQVAPRVEIVTQSCLFEEKLVEDLFEDDEGVESDGFCNPDAPLTTFHRDVEHRLVSSVLEIIEDHANSGTSAKDFGRLVVDMARRV